MGFTDCLILAVCSCIRDEAKKPFRREELLKATVVQMTYKCPIIGVLALQKTHSLPLAQQTPDVYM